MGLAEAVDAFEDAGAAEVVHAALYQKALDNPDAMKGWEKDFFVCPKCGNVMDAIADLPKCPICMTGTSTFITAG